MVEDEIADINELNEQQIKSKLELGQKALDEKNFENAKEEFSSIYKKTNTINQIEIVDGVVRSLTSNFEEVNQEQECFKNINDLYSLAKNSGRQDICNRCDQYFEYCKNIKEEEVFEKKLININKEIKDFKNSIRKLKTSDDIEIEKIKKEIQTLDDKRIIEKNKANKAVLKSVLATTLVIVMAIISSILIMTGSLVEFKNIIYIIDVILITFLLIIQVIKIRKLNVNNKIYKNKIIDKKINIKKLEDKINNNPNYEEAKKLNEEKIDILKQLENREKEKESIEEKLNSILVIIKKYESIDKGKVI